MNILLICIGKTNESYLKNGISEYVKRLSFYAKFDILEISNNKKHYNLNEIQLINKETDLILKHLNNNDYVVLLDSRGKEFDSLNFSSKLQQWMFVSKKKIVFIVGGAYGVSDSLRKRVNEVISLSKMTFSHQMIRLFFLEQLYRAYTILNNKPYHHQ